MAHWTVEGNIISVDFKKGPTDEELRRQAIDIMILSCDPANIGVELGLSGFVYESSLGFIPDTAPSEYVAPESDPA